MATNLPGLTGTYGTILADPPWRFKNRTGKVALEHSRLRRYATMTLTEICDMPVDLHAESKSHLYFWVPNALLPEGLAVLEARGVQYKGNLVFAREKSVPATSGPEPGFRSNWESRSRLAVAKLAAAVDVLTVPDDYPDILLKQNGSTETDDFVEVHIHGKLTQQCVESYRLSEAEG